MDRTGAYETAELAAAYDAVYGDVGDEDFWRDMAVASGGGPILELASGTGRVLIPLAEAGFDVVGIDTSEQMLDRCREKLAGVPPEVQRRVHLMRLDMTSFELGRTFAAVFCAFNSFHHLRAAEDQLACLGRCRAHLAPGGLLVLDLFNPDPESEAHAAEPAPTQVGGSPEFAAWTGGRQIRHWLSACTYDRLTQTNECETTYEILEADGSRTRLTEQFALRLIHRFELEHLLARSGFRLVKLFGDYDRSDFGVQSVGMIAVALRE